MEYYNIYADKLRDALTQTYIKHIQWQLKWKEKE